MKVETPNGERDESTERRVKYKLCALSMSRNSKIGEYRVRSVLCFVTSSYYGFTPFKRISRHKSTAARPVRPYNTALS